MKGNTDIYSRLKFRPYEDDDQPRIIQLWEKAFSKSMPVSVWRWKFHDNPYGRQMMTCFCQDEPVALYAGIPYDGNYLGRKVPFTHLMDSMTHPEFRGMGIFVQTYEHFLNEYGGTKTKAFHYGLPGRYHFQLAKKYMSYQEFPGGQSYLKARVSTLSSLKKGYLCNVRKLESFVPVFDHLQKRLARHFPFAARRDNKFIKWRFFDHPENNYLIYIYRNMLGKIKGYAAVLQQGGRATLSDCYVAPERKIIRTLLNKIGQDLEKRGCADVQTWLPARHFITGFLLECGFYADSEPTGFTPIWLKKKYCPEYEDAAKNVFFSMADGDLF